MNWLTAPSRLAGMDQVSTTQLDVVQEAAIGFVRRLRPGDRAMLVGFATGTSVLQALSDDIGQFAASRSDVVVVERSVAAFVIVGLAILGASVHAATEHATEGTCWLCALCPF